MKNNDKDKGSADLNNITPAKITLTTGNVEPSPASGRNTNKPAMHKWIVPLIILIIVAGGVFFVLPSHITTPDLEDSAGINAAQTATTVPARNTTPQKPESSPFQEAQEARQRSKSQDLLSDILKIQEELESKNVIVWGQEQYQNALGKATLGDEAYRNRNFVESSNLYAASLIDLQNLLAEMDTIFSDSIAQGRQSIEDGLSIQARQAFEYALQIYPDNEEAIKGLRRASTLDEVLQIMTEGNDLQQNNQLEPARERYQQVVTLDPDMEVAKQQISTVNRKINDRDFNQLMSSGYRNLEQDNLEAARLSFQKAKRLKPNAPEVLSALDQTQTVITNVQINQHITRAVEFERAENWTNAVQEYDKALALDANLAQAQEGKAYSDSRVKLDNRLNQIISEPERLSNKAVFEETRLIIQQANAIPSPEPRLAQQLASINQLLNKAMNPMNVIFRSDNETNVRLNRIGALGKFEQTSLSLLPGSYTVIGSREGYRDVRIEFSVPTDQQSIQPVTVIASERVSTR